MEINMGKKYKDDSIISLNGRDFTRLRPATYLGSNEYSTQLLREVFSNALDEHIIGHGNKITVTIFTKSNTYIVEDGGQGFPINVEREDGETVLQAAFDVINTSGKYDDDGVYNGASLGLNGIGSKLTNFLSKDLKVISSNGKQTECIYFEDGIFKSRRVYDSNGTSGTTVEWTPDPQFFQDPHVNINDVRKLFIEISALCPKLTIELKVDNKSEIFHSENGIQDLVDKKVSDKEILSNRFYFKKETEDGLFDIALTYTSDYSDTVIPYVNYGLTESGIHINTVKSLLTKQLNKYATDIGIIKKESDEFGSNELSEGLFIVFNLQSKNVKYDSQTKTRVVDLDRSLIRQVINNEFPLWLKTNPKEAKMILDRAILARKAREAAQKAKDGIRNAKSIGKKFISLPTKLVDAWSKDRKECELYICEGDSASNGLVAKRDGKTQAVFPIRGKVLSCRKASTDKIYANQEISNIVKAIGLDIDKSTGKLIYDPKKLRYNKIILAADADEDGANIRSLLINMFWWLCQELVEKGHLYVAVPPLFRVTTKNGVYIYCKDAEALKEYKKTNKISSNQINRNKGLGEMDPSELATCILKPNSRNIKKLEVSSVKDCEDMLECFFGNNVDIRREYLLVNN